jgi:hypothetical protein
MRIKTFRGLIADGAQDTIVLHTNDGSTGYRIVKFEMMANNPGTETNESTMKIYKISQTTVDNAVDFSDNTLLGAGYYSDAANENYGWKGTVVFDNEIFNQDIYITHMETVGSKAMNYYLELEQVKLDLNENTVATLKDIRNLA